MSNATAGNAPCSSNGDEKNATVTSSGIHDPDQLSKGVENHSPIKDGSGQPSFPVDLVATAAEYFSKGWVPVPEIDLRPQHEIRKPTIHNYGTKTYDKVEQVRAAFARTYHIYSAPAEDPDRELIGDFQPNGVGVLLGTRSGGLIDIDLDNPVAVALAHFFLPPTRVFGRASNPDSHWVYLCPSMTEADQKYCEYKGDIKIELRTGAVRQIKTTFPGSINSGEMVQWQNDLEIRVIEKITDLRARFDYLAAAVLIFNRWEDGKRTDLACSISGSIARSVFEDLKSGAQDEEWATKTIEYWDKILHEIAAMRGDHAYKKRLTPSKAYRDLHEAIRMEANNESGPRVQGVASLYRVLDKDDARNLVRWLGLKEAGAENSGGGGGDDGPDADALERLQEFNEDHAFMDVKGKSRIATFDGGGYVLSTTGDARERFANLPSIQVQVGNRIKMVKFFPFWLQWEGRRFIDKVIFDPSNATHPATTLNTWKGWAIQPQPGNCQMYLDHIKTVIADGNESISQWIIAWLADLFQHPTRRTGTALVMRGERGIGKGAFVEPLKRILGTAAIHLHDSSRISGRFNSQLADRLLVFADEAWYAGDKRHEGVLKAIITENTIDIERKGLEPETHNNYNRLIMASNSEWVAPAGFRERRFCILDVSDAKIQNREYFGALHKQMTTGGDAALLDYLLKVDLDDLKSRGINPAVAPKTIALTENALESLKPGSAIQFMHSILDSGAFPVEDLSDGTREKFNSDGFEWGWKEGASVEGRQLLLLHSAWVKTQRGAKAKSSGVMIGRALASAGITKRNDQRSYTLPSLAAARHAFVQNVLNGDPIRWTVDSVTHEPMMGLPMKTQFDDDIEIPF